MWNVVEIEPARKTGRAAPPARLPVVVARRSIAGAVTTFRCFMALVVIGYGGAVAIGRLRRAGWKEIDAIYLVVPVTVLVWWVARQILTVWIPRRIRSWRDRRALERTFE